MHVSNRFTSIRFTFQTRWGLMFPLTCAPYRAKYFLVYSVIRENSDLDILTVQFFYINVSLQFNPLIRKKKIPHAKSKSL